MSAEDEAFRALDQALTKERGETHGDFTDNARISQTIKNIVRVELLRRTQRGQSQLSNTQVDALDMIAAKIGRILAGDPDFRDHWEDIAGYSHIACKSTSRVNRQGDTKRDTLADTLKAQTPTSAVATMKE